MSPDALVECVPNFSEGRDREKIDAIARAIQSVEGVKLLDVDPGKDTNRTVYTFIGTPQAVADAALEGARAAFICIDMQIQKGAHPRIGALDVCPFVPVSGISMDECIELARQFGMRLAAELDVPVYLYEKAASRPERQSLANIRTGEYEGLPDKLKDPEWAPDFGPTSFNPMWGATVVGAREFLIAYNINLNTRDKKLAHDIALAIREGGRLARGADGAILRDTAGEPVKMPGRLKAVRAIGWYIEEYRCAQVSVNLMDYATTPLWEVFETTKEEAEKRGLFVTGSELVGLAPLECLLECGRHFLAKAGKSEGAPGTDLVEMAVKTMGMDSVSDFEPARKVVEWAYRGPGPLVSRTVGGFVDEVSRDTPAPGGGSVAALAGSLGAALAAMVGNLTVGKKGYEESRDALSAMAREAQETKNALIALIDEDTAAFNGVLEAIRLPKATEEQREEREKKMREANERAASIPMSTARACLRAMRHCQTAASLGNRNSASDAAVGALMAFAGIEGAALNVRTNLPSISDETLRAALAEEAKAIVREGEALKGSILGIAGENIPSA